MSTITLAPVHKQQFQIQPERSHPTLSLRRVLWVRFLRWIDKASTEAIRKAATRIAAVLSLLVLVVAPQFFLGVVTSTATWNGYRVPLFIGLLWLTLRARRIVTWLRRAKVSRSGNAHTYAGLPVDELASYLFEQRAFTRDHAMRSFGISQIKHGKIAEELEKNKILVRGENNARVLNEITREELVRQLRDDFPLVWSLDRKVWVERGGSFDRFLLDRERAEHKEQEKIERLERKKDRLQKDVSTLGFLYRELPS